MMRSGLIRLVVVSSLLLAPSVGYANMVSDTSRDVVTVTMDVVRWGVRATWGVVKLIQKVPADAFDTGFRNVGKFLGTEPNLPLWE